MRRGLGALRVALAIPVVSIAGLQFPTSAPTTSSTTTSTTTTTPAPAVRASAPGTMLGFYDEQAGNGDVTRLDAVERWQRRGHAVVGLFSGFDPQRTAPTFAMAETLWRRGNVPMITWMPWLGNTPGVDYNRAIADGAYDTYVRDWANRARAFLSGPDAVYGNGDDRRLYLRFAHEANGDWYGYAPAFGGTAPSSYIAMWRHVHDVFVARGIDDPTRLAWVYSVIDIDAWSGPPAEAMFPGDAYVDWIAIDGYNWGTAGGHSGWPSPADVFGPMTARLRAISGRPLAITEVGVTTDGATIAQKSAWISQYFEWTKANDVGLTMWFNHYPAMWEIFGGRYGDEVVDGSNAYAAYRTAAGDPALVVTDRSNARLLTDEQFTGGR
jgi:hypothetical protein